MSFNHFNTGKEFQKEQQQKNPQSLPLLYLKIQAIKKEFKYRVNTFLKKQKKQVHIEQYIKFVN